MAVVTMKQLLDSGVHFGHQTRRWNPKMKRYILTERNGIYIIDLQQTLSYIDRAYEFVKETVAHGGTIMFVGTKKQAQEAIADEAGRVEHAVREPALAGRDAHQLPDRAQAAPAAQGAGGDGADGGLRGSHQEGDPHAHPREGQAGEDPRRHPRHGQGPERGVDRRHQEGAHRRRRGPQAGHPGRVDPRHQLRPGRGRLPDPGQRRRDPLGRAAHQGDRPRRRRRPDGPLAARRRGEGAEAGTGTDEPLAEWEQELLTSGTGSDGASLPDAAAEAADAGRRRRRPAASTNGTQQTAG